MTKRVPLFLNVYVRLSLILTFDFFFTAALRSYIDFFVNLLSIHSNVVVASALCYCYLTVLPEINFWAPRC